MPTQPIISKIRTFAERDYADFIASLAPSVSRDRFIGVRVPTLRKIAKSLTNEEKEVFLKELPHYYYEENLIHGFIISGLKDYERAIKEADSFLPFVDNWAVSDTMMPKCFSKNKSDLLLRIDKWINSNQTYAIRFGVDCLMNLYLEDDFKIEYLNKVAAIKSEEYYVNMMIAWYFATALAKQYEATIKLIEAKTLSKWIQNKTIQKAKESFRIDAKTKSYLDSLKIK